MQNLVGVFFLLFFVYFLLNWISSSELGLNKQLFLTITFFILTFLTHIYTAGIAIVLLTSVILFKLVIDYKISKKFPKKELKIFLGSIVLVFVILFITFILYPGMIADFLKFQSFLNSFLGQNSNQFDAIMFISIPFLGGLLFILKNFNLNNLKRLYISFALIILSSLLFFLSLPIIASEWETRFILLNFIPISLVSSIAIYTIYTIDFTKIVHFTKKVNIKRIIVYSLCIIFILSSLISMSNFIPTMGPTITESHYQELLSIKQQFYGNTIKAGDVIITSNGMDEYWFSLIFSDNNIIGSNSIRTLDFNSTNYFIFNAVNTTSPYIPPQLQIWNIFLPLGYFTNSRNNPNLNNQPLQRGSFNQNPQQSPTNPRNSSPKVNNPLLQDYSRTTVYQGSYFNVFELDP